VTSAQCTECRALLGGYVLHALDADEAEAVRHHLAACDACASELGQLMGLPALLDVAGSVESHSEQPPAALEEAVLDRFAREHPAVTRKRAAGASAAAGEAEPAAAGKTERASRRLRRPPGYGRLAAVRHKLSRPLPAALAGAVVAATVTAALVLIPDGSVDGGRYTASLAGTPAIPTARASADLRVLDAGTHVNLSVRGLRGQPDSVYELWCIRDDGVKISAGTFRTDSAGRADVSLTTAAVPGEYHRLSVERKAFSPATQGGERVMAGEIDYPRQ
jgi:anti-sigma-K factor RskA